MIRDIFRSAPRNLLSLYWGRNIGWHILAVALTALIVLSGIDWWFFEATRSPLWQPLVITAGITGFFFPFLVGVLLYIVGRYRKDERLKIAGAAAVQAVVLSWLVTGFYKALTGRLQPEFMNSTVDISRAFQFGFWRHGVFWGWPSTHTGGVWALTFAIAPFVRRPTVIVAGAYAIFVSLGAAIGFHWFSDVVAGLIIGTLIGYVVAESFRARIAR